MSRYRVNYGQGQVSHSFFTKRDAFRYIAECKAQGNDPYVAHYFVERRDIGSADCPGDWIKVRP